MATSTKTSRRFAPAAELTVEDVQDAQALQPCEPFARGLIDAVLDAGNGHDGSQGPEAVVTKAHARRVAVQFGSAMLEATNLETAKHCDDVVVVARALCDQLQIHGTERQDLLAAARLHDIGKVSIPLEVLRKPGPLDHAQWELMRKHTVVGHQILGSVPELEGIAKMVKHSHERWDGDGYPDGLAGERIPLGSRVIFCADAFHAIREDRPYRNGRSAASAFDEIKRCAGTQFDPTVVAAFEQVAKDLRLAPVGARVRRSSRLMALLLMLSIGVTGSAIASSDLLGSPAAAGPAAGASSFASGQQLLPPSLGDPFTGRSANGGLPGAGAPPPPFGAAGSGSTGTPGDATTGSPSAAGETTFDDGSGSGGGSPGGGTGSGSDHPQGGPPGQTGDHPNGGPPGQTGNHPQGGPPGQTGSHPNGGPPGQSGSSPGNSGNSAGNSSSSPGNSGNAPGQNK